MKTSFLLIQTLPRTVVFVAIIFLALPYSLFPQSLLPVVPREETNNIVIEESGIYALPKGVSDKISVDIRTSEVLHRFPDSVRSYWYKVYVAVDSRITFEIHPSDPSNRYNYFLYQQQGDLSVEEVYTTSIAPVRANLYNDKMKIGTGLSLSSKVSTNDSCPRNLIEIFYGTPYHAPVSAKAGDVLLLNVYHLRGTDCGHHFVLKGNKYSLGFHSIYERCYNEQEVLKKEGHSFQPGPLFIRKPTGKAKGLFVVRDSIRQSKMDCKVTCVKQGNDIYATTFSETKDLYEILLEKSTSYQIIFSAFGYQNKTVSVVVQDSLVSFTKEILLTLIKEGDAFVMDEIFFYPNTYALRPGSISQIDQLSAYLHANPGIKIEIQGHTSGNKRIRKSYNGTQQGLVAEGRFRGSAKKLSQYRADLIKKHLHEKGISSDRLISSGYGGSKMIYPYPKDQEEADKNIRVGVLILSQVQNELPVSGMSK